jgi:hypothetical protein
MLKERCPKKFEEVAYHCFALQKKPVMRAVV